MPRVTLELDSRLMPRENVERCFRRYQKSRRALGYIEERRVRLEGERERIETLAALVEACGDPESLEALEAEARSCVGRRSQGRTRGPAETAPIGPRRFVSADGFAILVGRNARQNDELTLRIGRGNDWFFHISSRPGAHVLVRSIPGKSPPLETILDAAHLALYYSLPTRSSATLVSGAAAEVDYAQLKHVRKPKGAAPGLVLLASHKTLRVKLDAERLHRLRAEAGNDPAGGAN
jgi:predicted ribosome quality control (RQC) complex YloA/Tae2 family protein